MGLIEDNEINNNTLAGVWITTGIKKSALYLSVNVFSTELLIGDNIFYVPYWRRDRHFTWSSEPREG